MQINKFSSVNRYIIYILPLLLIFINSAYSQKKTDDTSAKKTDKTSVTKTDRSVQKNTGNSTQTQIDNSLSLKSKTPVTPDPKPKLPDYKVLNSNETNLEIEFIPEYTSDYDFSGSVSNSSDYGSPDVKLRSFSVIFPGNTGNRIEIIDAKYTDIQNADIQPVPTFKYSKNKDGIVPVFNRNEKIYNENKFFPANAVSIIDKGSLRNKYFGFLNISPLQYDPVTGTVRKYTYIRVRVTFGSAPVYSAKNLSREERLFLQNIAINSPAASNWSTNEFNTQKDIHVQNSVLASGDFYKLEVLESGMYRLDKNFFQGAGINISSIDPRTIKITGTEEEKCLLITRYLIRQILLKIEFM